MIKLSQKSTDFIIKNILPEFKLDSINDDNLQEIIDYISDNYEIPLAQAKESDETIDDVLLELAASVITEITTNPEW